MRVTLRLVMLILAAQCCFAQAVFPVRDTGQTRSRSYHVVHYRIEVSFDEQARKVFGRVSTTLVPFLSQFRTIDFDAEQMDIRRVTLAGTKTLTFTTEPKQLVIQLDTTYSYEDTITVTIDYSCTPKRGLYFVQPDSGYPATPRQIWTQGEDMDNHFWFPCYDFPNDKATSELIATVRSSYTVLSNGALVSVTEDRKKGTRTFHWRESRPHSSYLIMLAAGEYAVLRDHAAGLPLTYYVYPNDTTDARICFHETPDMVAFFSRMIGYTYPWEKYAQVLIHDFIEGGMENTSATALADDITVFDARARVDHSPTSLIAHELAHQWWGDVVTCKDWRHLWLNEGFASYFDPLYHEHAFGRDEFDYSMYRNQQEGIETDKRLGRKPIVSVGSYGANIYARGSAVLHMLRFVLGDQLFWRALHHYIARYQFMPVETHDLQEAIEEATGQNLYWFFDQWLYKAGYPVFHLSYRYSDTTHSVLLSVRQEQKIDSLTGVFRSPVDIDIASHAGTITHHVDILTRDTTFTLPCPAPPQLVIFDKGNWLLKELVWEKSRDEWMYQSESARNPIDRILAVQQLARLSNNESFVPLLSRIARHDRFWAVRREAVTTAGRLMVEDEPLRQQLSAALIAATSDPRPEVRTAAVGQLGNFRGANITDALRASLHDSSYDVVAAALGSLTRADSAGAAPVLEQYVDVPSYRNILQIVALRSLVRVDSSEGIALALQKTRYGEPQWTRFTALSILDRYAKGREEFKPLLSSLVDDKNRLIQSTAIRMLGEIGNKADLPLLERIASDKENQNAATAEGSIEKILKRKSGDQ